MLTPPTPARRRRRDDWHRSDGGLWLPGAADVPRVAGDPMRGAGMVRRGMGFGFEPAGCCCGKEPAPCTYRNFFDFEYDITISGMFNNIDGIGWGQPPGYNDVQGADAINGTHRVTWLRQEQPYPYYLCDPPYAGGCVWKITTTDVGIVVDYKSSSSPDEVDSLTVYLMVTPNYTFTEKIDVMVLVMAGVYGAEQYAWGATNLSCEIECLDGLELARCGRHYGDAFGLATDPAIINVVP